MLDTDETDQRTGDGTARLIRARPAQRAGRGWLDQLAQTGWETFEKLPAPARSDETWRFASLKRLDLSPFRPPLQLDETVRGEMLRRSRGIAAIAGRMVFGNDQLLVRELASKELEQRGVIWLPLAEAAERHPELFRKHFMREDAVLGGRKFAALHQSQVRAGCFLYVPHGVELSLPLEVFHWLHGDDSSCFPHTLIIAEALSKVTLVDYFASIHDSARGLACGVNDLWLGDGAKVTYVSAQEWSNRTVAFQLSSTVVGRDASAVALHLNLGGDYVRTESVSHLRASGGRSDMLAVSVADGTQEFDQRTLQIHEVPNTASDLLYKNALDESSRTIFAGLIRVNPGAHKTDAYQKVRNLLLSDEAEANSAPGLEIEADDVRCTHGATSGQIDPEELFYLQSRGIRKREAQRLIAHGFLQEVIDRVGNEAIAAKLSELVHAKFDRHF